MVPDIVASKLISQWSPPTQKTAVPDMTADAIETPKPGYWLMIGCGDKLYMGGLPLRPLTWADGLHYPGVFADKGRSFLRACQ